MVNIKNAKLIDVRYIGVQAVAYLGFHFGGGSNFFLEKWGICMARSAMQRVAKPRVW